MTSAFGDRRNVTANACPIDDCGALKEQGQAFCKQHWFKLPKIMRDKIWQTFKQRNWSEWKSAFEAARTLLNHAHHNSDSTNLSERK